MSKLHLYGYAKCGTCRNALKALRERGWDVEFVDVFERPPAKEVLRELWRTSGLELKKLFNVSGEVYKEMNLKDKLPGMSEEERLDLLASNGRLIKRPIVTDGSRTTVGFREAEFAQVWNR